MHLGLGLGCMSKRITILHARIEPFDKGVPHLPGAIGEGIKRELDKRILRSRLQQHQRARRRVLGEDGEVDASAAQGRAQGKRHSTVQPITGNRSGGRFLG